MIVTWLPGVVQTASDQHDDVVRNTLDQDYGITQSSRTWTEYFRTDGKRRLCAADRHMQQAKSWQFTGVSLLCCSAACGTNPINVVNSRHALVSNTNTKYLIDGSWKLSTLSSIYLPCQLFTRALATCMPRAHTTFLLAVSQLFCCAAPYWPLHDLQPS